MTVSNLLRVTIFGIEDSSHRDGFFSLLETESLKYFSRHNKSSREQLRTIMDEILVFLIDYSQTHKTYIDIRKMTILNGKTQQI